MAKPLTALSVRRAKANGARREIPDGGCPGLYLIVQESEHKSWALRYRAPIDRDKRRHRKPRKLTLGPLAGPEKGDEPEPKIGHPLTLADARRLALEQLRLIRKGVDPAQVLRAHKLHFPNLSGGLIEDVFAEFLAKHVRRKSKGTPIRESTRRKTGRLLGLRPGGETLSVWIPIKPKSGVLAYWKGRAAGSITKADVRSVTDDIAIRAPVHANRTLSAIKQAFAWAVSNDVVMASPAIGVDSPSPEQGRKRILEPVEIVAIWRAAERLGYPYGRAIQMLLLTGQRLDEVVSAVWSEFDRTARTWTLPENRTKNGKRHLVPLSRPAVVLLEGLPRIHSRAGYLFTRDGSQPIINPWRPKRQLDELAIEEISRLDPEGDIAPWRHHDMRHTLKTWMQRAGITKDVRDAVQNHFTSDMDARYGHYTFEAEKRDALERWAAYVTGLAGGGSVRALHQGARAADRAVAGA
jgi:integrase